MDEATLEKLMRKYPVTELATGNLRTCPVRLSYPHLFKPHVSKKFAATAEPKYSATLLFPKGADLSLLENAAEATAAEVFGSKWRTAKVRMPFIDQGEEGEQAGYVPGAKLLRCNASKPVGVKQRDGRTDADENDVWPGVWALVTVRPFGSDYGTKRVTFGLQNVMVLGFGERIAGGGAKAEDDFADADMSADEDLLADLETAGAEPEYDFG